MTADDEHTELLDSWLAIRLILDEMPSLPRWLGETERLEVRGMADRVQGLGSHLQGAVTLMQDLRYESAFALLRTGLEHMVVDWLVFRGRTFVQHFTDVSDEIWWKWEKARAEGAEWTKTVKDWKRTRKGKVRIVHEGLYSEPAEDGTREQISIYYFLLEQYRPALGPPGQQVDDGLLALGDLKTLAEENRTMWEVYLRWSSLLMNLQENGLIDEADAGRLAVHYRFLSGYTHPVADQRRATYGKDAWQGWPRYDHYASELILLYALRLGALEIQNFLTMLSGRTDVTVDELGNVQDAVATANAAARYFWFLGDSPHDYDVWNARNASAFRAWREEGDSVSPTAPTVSEVGYPSDPLNRLVAMHRSAQEMTTGLVYVSPWPRPDADFR